MNLFETPDVRWLFTAVTAIIHCKLKGNTSWGKVGND